MIHKLLISTLLIGAATAVAANAQDSAITEERISSVFVGDKEAAVSFEEEMILNMPKEKRASGLPRFAIIGHDRKFYMGIGVQANAIAEFDWGDEMPSAVDFTPSSIVPRTAGNGGNLRFQAASSSIYMNIVALPGSENRVGLFFKGKFSGPNYGFKMSHLYVKYRGLTAGYNNSLFEDSEAMPYTIDSEGPNGSASLSVMTGSWTQNFTDNFSGAIGIESTVADMTNGSYAVQTTQRLPAIPLYLQYGRDKDTHIRFSAIMRPMQYRNLKKQHNENLFGWGIQLSGLTKIAGPVTLYFDATYGYGIGSYLQDDADLGLDATPNYAKAGKMNLVQSLGLTGGLSFDLGKKWESNLTYSHLTNWTKASCRPAGSVYRYGDYVAANVMYDLNKFLTFGIEYDYGHAKDFSGNSVHANRLQGLLSVSF